MVQLFCRFNHKIIQTRALIQLLVTLTCVILHMLVKLLIQSNHNLQVSSVRHYPIFKRYFFEKSKLAYSKLASGRTKHETSRRSTFQSPKSISPCQPEWVIEIATFNVSCPLTHTGPFPFFFLSNKKILNKK